MTSKGVASPESAVGQANHHPKQVWLFLMRGLHHILRSKQQVLKMMVEQEHFRKNLLGDETEEHDHENSGISLEQILAL